MKQILFVSIAFPPKNDPECLQTARYFKYLVQDKEFVIDVVTSKIPTLFMPEDKTLSTYDTGYRQRIEVQIWESRFLSFALRKLGAGQVFFPDSKMTFHWQWKKVVEKLKAKPDIIYSRSNPMSSAFMAMKLKKHYNVPWIMHLSDAWAISPLELTPTGKVGDEWRQKEQELLQEANAVTFTSRQTVELYSRRFPALANKFSVLPNVYDPADINASPVNNRAPKLRVVYTGGLTGNRNVFFLDQVFKIMQEKKTTLPDMVEFIFAGALDRINRNYFGSCPSWIKHVGIISHHEVRELCDSAHLLLVVDNPTSEQDAIFFPSKLLDYFLVRKMIWAVTPESSTTRDILKGYHHRSFRHDETEQMATFLQESVTKLEQIGSEVFLAANIPDAYNAAHNVEKLKALLTVTGRHQ